MVFKQILSRQENKSILRKYEAALPSWTVVMAQYTGYYRPWQRKVLRIITFLASVITVSIGLYDLYKHFPSVFDWLSLEMEDWTGWFHNWGVFLSSPITFFSAYII